MLRKEFDARKRAGLPGRWLSASALFRRTGIRAEAAIATSGNAQVNPLRACHGFLAAAARRGARIFERSHARSVKESDSGIEVRTNGGTISASRIVVATGYATREFRSLVGRFRLKDTYVLATRRLPAPARPPGHGVGYRSAVSLPAMDRGWATAVRRGRYPSPFAKGIAPAHRAGARAFDRVSRADPSGSGGREARTMPGKGCLRRPPTASHTSASTPGIRGICSPWDTEGMA